jgi:hypothetical protein
MDANELRHHALKELHRRLAVPRSYSLPSEDGSKITVLAAIVEGDRDEITESNSFNCDALRRSAKAPDDGMPIFWLNATGGKPVSLTFAQIRFLAGA